MSLYGMACLRHPAILGGVFGKMKKTGLPLLALAVALMSACDKKPPAPPPPPHEPISVPRVAPPERVEGRSPEALLGTLHHAAQEMALDGFQFDKPELGWPFDCGASSSSAYLGLLAEKGYLSARDLGLFEEVEISNLSDSDPGGTALAKVALQKKIHLLRKDGSLSVETDEAGIFPVPPRDPVWLPK